VVNRHGERGSSLLVAILATALIGSAVMLLSSDLTERQRLFRLQARTVTLDHLADAALAEALAELTRDSGFQGRLRHQFGDGVIWSEVTASDQGVDTRLVVAKAEFDGWLEILRAQVAVGPDGPSIVQWRRSTQPVQGSSRLLRRKSSSLR
jgi:hypothetical protein